MVTKSFVVVKGSSGKMRCGNASYLVVHLLVDFEISQMHHDKQNEVGRARGGGGVSVNPTARGP